MSKILILPILFLISQSTFAIDLSVDENILSGDLTPAQTHQADIHFQGDGNNFPGKILLIDTVDSPEIITISGNSISCKKQIRGLFWNNARGNRVWPLDPWTLNTLSGLDSSYQNITMSGGLYANCDGDTTHIYGAIHHQWMGENYRLVAGVDYNFANNSYHETLAETLRSTATDLNGYRRDSYGGIGEISGSGVLICDSTWIGDRSLVCSRDSFVQTNACGQTRTINGTKYCSSGNGTPRLKIDDCPDGDFSPSYYDHNCGEEEHDEEHYSANVSNEIKDFLNNFNSDRKYCSTKHSVGYNQELKDAFEYSYDKGITTLCPIEIANLDGPLIRKHLAKMISMYAIQELGKTPDLDKKCNFVDMYGESKEMQNYAKLACQLGLMGLNANGVVQTHFEPNQEVNRAMFGTAFDRLLNGTKNNANYPNYRGAHLNQLKKDEIMNKIDDPAMLEQRGYTMLMFLRAIK